MSRDSEDPAIERDEPSDPLLPYHLDGSVQNPRRWFHLTNENCNEDIVYEAFESITLQLSLLFQNITDTLTANQTSYLKALVNEETKLSSKHIINKYKLGTSANVIRIKKALESKEIIDSTERTIEFLDPVYKHWLSKYYFH